MAKNHHRDEECDTPLDVRRDRLSDEERDARGTAFGTEADGRKPPTDTFIRNVIPEQASADGVAA